LTKSNTGKVTALTKPALTKQGTNPRQKPLIPFFWKISFAIWIEDLFFWSVSLFAFLN
jgi:hypothetical protein